MSDRFQSRTALRRSLDKRRNSAVLRLQALSEEHTKLVAILKGLESVLEVAIGGSGIDKVARRIEA
jgi:hypothetical protein